MQSCKSRVRRWPLALTLMAVAACADDQPSTAPRATRPSRQAVDGNVILVTTASGANVPGSLAWAFSYPLRQSSRHRHHGPIFRR